MIPLSDDELSEIADAPRPLRPRVRSDFLVAVTAELEHQPQPAPVRLFRFCRNLRGNISIRRNLSGAPKYE